MGFIIHELITNSIKYAWNESDDKQIKIEIAEENGEVTLNYSDNGIGLPPDFNIPSGESLGMKLVHSFVDRQLQGEIELLHGNGARFIIKFQQR